MIYLKNKPIRLKGKAYERLIKSVFERDNYTCQACYRSQPEDNHSLNPHHKIFKSQGGDDSMENVITMCWECHRMLHDGLISRNFWSEK